MGPAEAVKSRVRTDFAERTSEFTANSPSICVRKS
jgi:hypothetical protein